MSSEPYGTTPLPANGVSLRYDPGEVWEIAQQPKSSQLAAYEGYQTEESIHGGSVVDVNQHFVIYAVKKGLIRILHRHSTLRTLFRGHEGQVVTDIHVFLDGDVIGSVGSTENGDTSTVIIWRVFERTPEIMSEILLEISTSAYNIARLIWHPFNPNQFWIVRTEADAKRKVASLVDTTRISTLPHETKRHAVCMFYRTNIIMDGVVELAGPSVSSLTDLDWSEKDVRHVLSTHQGGEIRLWDLRKVDPGENVAIMIPHCVCMIQENQPLSRCKFLPHECPRDQPSTRDAAFTNCFLTASENNAVVTLWSPFGEEGTPTKLQVFGLEHPSPSYLLDFCYGPSPPDGPPPSLFLLMADQSEGKLYAWHLQSEWQEQTVVSLVGCDYVVPFVTSYPMYSWSTQVHPAADISEDELNEHGGLVFDMKLFSYQSSVVQCLILTSFMCLPPASQFQESTFGVTVEYLPQEVAASQDLALSEDFDGEDYDVGDDDDHDEAESGNEADYSEPPAASSLPVPEGLDSPAPEFGGGANSFANWLGALAGKTPAAPIPPPPVVKAPVAAPSPAPRTSTTTMLTPADLFPNHPSIQTNANADAPKQQEDQNRSRSQRQNQQNQKLVNVTNAIVEVYAMSMFEPLTIVSLVSR
jgi:WD40 region of Ge1, enhancer of mRNA-decapping protein